MRLWRIFDHVLDGMVECEFAMSASVLHSIPITNVAAYRFAELTDLKSLRQRLLSLCRGWGLKGTILISMEGINLFVAGGSAEIDLLLAELRSIQGLESLAVKTSESDHQPFSRMLVRIKKEIIAFGVDGINPARRTSPKLPPATLKQWLDEGRRITLLDTRNDYEIKLGTFRGALPAGIDHFRDFPQAVERFPESLKDEPIVMFCTGGIRCEKAGPYMEREGFREIYQLDGGILKYFEECGGAHYDGECFVFDQRVGVDPALRETETMQCFKCLSPLSEADQRDERYVPDKSCPHCFQTRAEQMAARIEMRESAVRLAATPLPGSKAYDNFRPLTIPLDQDGQTILAALGAMFSHSEPEKWGQIFQNKHLLGGDKNPVDPEQIVRSGERYFRKLPSTIEPDVNPDIRFLHEDEAIIVVNKPAPLPVHPSGRFNLNSLQSLLQKVYHPQKPRPAHRLDANTTGIVVFSRTRHFAKLLQPQFERGEVEKTYLVRVLGRPAGTHFFCDAPIGTSPVDGGGRIVDLIHGMPSRTEFRVREYLSDGTTILEAMPLTGRTNQIRVHLWHMGTPVVGDPLYQADQKLTSRQTLSVDDPPLNLHAWKLAFTHPLSHQRITFESDFPCWVIP